MNLLTDPIFRVQTPMGMEAMALPALLAALGLDRVESLPGLQRHQEDAFHIFLCYLSGAALARASRSDPRQEAGFWTKALRRMATRNDDSAWTLLVADTAKPAFMQPPLVSEDEFLKEYKTERSTPDAIDVLLTAKNHDIKSTKSMAPRLDEWAYALISMQTMSGYILKHQGIARMNSGLGSRACVSVVYGETLGQRWQRDTRKLIAVRPDLLRAPWPYQPDGLVLTWLQPWNRKTSLDLDQLDPFFIEVSRGVRLVWQDGRVAARTSTEQSPRINAKAYNGVLGDPWIPINCNDPKKGESALTVGSLGFTPELLRNLIFEDGYELGPMQRPDREQGDQPFQFTASVLVRGQGTTDGFRTAALNVPGSAARRVFQSGPQRERLARLSKVALTDAAELQNRALKPAVLSLLQAGSERIDFEKREITAWWQQSARRYATAWGAMFFEWLWEAGESASDEEALRNWRLRLKDCAWSGLTDAMSGYPGREGRRYRARIRSESIFYRNLHKLFPELKEFPHDFPPPCPDSPRADDPRTDRREAGPRLGL
jgi:CRISPR system Cascade subunit CasA